MEYINRPYTYLISDGRYYKIGESLNPFRRLKQLRTANPFVKLIGYTKKYSESRLHQKFNKWKIKGEWFDLPQYEVDSLLEEIHKPKYEKQRKVKHDKEIDFINYLIQFGKYRGRLMYTMTEKHELAYMRKQIKNFKKYSEEWIVFKKWLNYTHKINKIPKKNRNSNK